MEFLSELSDRFAGAADFSVRPIFVAGTDCTLCFLDGLVSGSEIGELVLRPLAQLPGWPMPEALLERAVTEGGQTASASICRDVADAEAKLLAGFCLLIVPGAGAAAFETKSGEKRGPSEPEVESTTRGPKDAFTETARTNTGLLRRHLRTARLRLWETTVGRESRTGVSLLWLEGLTDPETVVRMQKRLSSIDTEDLLTPAAVEHVLPGKRRTAFPLLQYTERTDKFAAGLLAGRVGLFVDGLPVGYLAPVNLGYLLEAAEDKDTDFLSARFLKLLRLVALACALLLPALYVAMATFHQEMIPTKLLLAIIESKKQVPFPTVLEVLGLLAAFEILQEAGLSAPKAISQPVSIIGGLVVGTAAAEANLISPAALIVVSAAGICGFALPGKSFSDAVRLCRFAFTVLASLAGLFGLTLGLIALTVHLSRLDSLGRPWLAPYADL
jgi:spore germination protein KA